MLHASRANRLAIAFTLAFPTLVTAVYFVMLAEAAAVVQWTAYTALKIAQFGFPLLWAIAYLRERPRIERPRWSDWAWGLGFGAAAFLAMFALYRGWLAAAPIFEAPAEAMREKMAGMRLASAWRFAALGVFYSLAHSLLEEYYWRWFVFRQLTHVVSLGAAIAISSLGFMAHHVLVLSLYFGWTSPLTWLFSFAIAAGGAIWAWMYHRQRSLYAPWISHALIDAAIFTIGYDLAAFS